MVFCAVLFFSLDQPVTKNQILNTKCQPVGSPRLFGQSPMEVDHAHGGIYPDAIPAQLIALKWLILYKEKCKEYIES